MNQIGILVDSYRLSGTSCPVLALTTRDREIFRLNYYYGIEEVNLEGFNHFRRPSNVACAREAKEMETN